MKKIVFIIFIAITLSGCSLPWQKKVANIKVDNPEDNISSSTPFFYDISLAEAKEIAAAKQDLVIIDVSISTSTSLFPEAKKMSLSELSGLIGSLDKKKPYLIYSDNNQQSALFADKLTRSGFGNVYHLDNAN